MEYDRDDPWRRVPKAVGRAMDGRSPVLVIVWVMLERVVPAVRERVTPTAVGHRILESRPVG